MVTLIPLGGEQAALTLDRIRAAAGRLAGLAHRTPLLTSATLDARCGARVCLKAEPFQRGGAFKFRGAYNRLSLLSADERARGVVAYSSGNHGGAVALASSVLGVHAVVVVPETGSPAKLAAIEGYGAEIRRYDPARERREVVAAALAEERSLTVIAPFDDYDVMAGQGTLGLELAEQAGELDLVLVPVGGGGLAAGVATAVTSLLPGTAVIGVEPAGADDTYRSLRAGRRVSLEAVDTIADGLRASQPGELTFPINQRLLSDVVTVDDAAIIEAMWFCFSRLKVVVEPSGAVPLAALLAGAVRADGRRTAVVLSGGNIDPADFASLLHSGRLQPRDAAGAPEGRSEGGTGRRVGPRRQAGSTASEPPGRGAAWTEERGTSDEGRRCLKAPRRQAGNTADPPAHG